MMDSPAFFLDGEDVYGLKMDFYLASVGSTLDAFWGIDYSFLLLIFSQ